jgi:capsular polysaccharide export protein
LPQRSLLELFTVALGHYCRYAHPATGHRLTFSEALAHVELQQAVRRGTPRHVAVVDAQPWKKRIYRDFLPGATLTYLSQDEVGVEPVPGQCLVLWGQRVAQSRVDQWRAAGHRVWQCEDGFLRSVGLGCELARPLSLSFDETGLYADPRTNSDLLAAIRTPLDAQQTADARAFLRLHHDLRLSKYVGITQDEGVHWRTAHVLAGVERPVMLVCGQVADDISMRASGCPYTSYEHLIGALRVNRPEAFVIYRPHPDVVKGLRPGELTVHNADLNDTQSATRALAERAEEVHVINSLTGFEALMAGKKVVTWGRAWYAGWGLTHDAVQPARDVSATLEQLVHAAYLQRPRYFDHRSAQFVTASVAAELLARERASAHAAPGWVARVLAWVPRRITRRAARLYERVSERLSDARA